MASKGKHGGKGKGGGAKGGGGGAKAGGAQAANATGPFKWESIPAMPTKRVYSSAIEHNGLLYVIGGSDQRGQTLDAFECYNPKRKKWLRLLNLPHPRAQPAVVIVGSKIVVIGGVGSDALAVNFVDIYDVEQKKWSEDVKHMDERLQGVSAVVHNGKVIVIGGMLPDTNPVATSSVYDIEQNIWLKLPELPTPRYAAGTFLKGDKLYLLGGMLPDTNPVATSSVYDIEQNIWLKLPELPTPRYAAGTFLKGDKLYLLGGRIGKKACQAFEMLDLGKQPAPEWTTLTELPKKLVFSCYQSNDSHFYRLGGLNETQQGVIPKFDDTVAEFSIDEGKWNDLPSMSNKRGDFAAAVLDDKLVAVGGLGPSEKPNTDAEYFDRETNQWVFIDHCPTMRGSGTYVMFQDKLFVIGGFTPQGLTGAVDALSHSS